ncbi:heavy-metal-associated domain-containing protein [Marinibactrum halimedae]|uniref:HMA domain-containing protein n=1 Tax=Marinibactrum halimedae TaxID=1444977 RepID=A0AA37T4X0_9GAMM|nr:heavy-metal-associated domain-containing protein [Marinibactrum halimedae]MCD9460680.1 cation transporter [Marinibactrum halimedae]GLS24326.1 hypothetical protein GCM10007877_00370 [Marinibactrum halimedae]
MKIILFILVFGVYQSNAAFAKDATGCTSIIDIEVNGLVCDFCARALEKVFGRNDSVQDVQVNLDEGKVSVILKPNKIISDDDLRELIQDSGYNVASIDRGICR